MKKLQKCSFYFEVFKYNLCFILSIKSLPNTSSITFNLYVINIYIIAPIIELITVTVIAPLLVYKLNGKTLFKANNTINIIATAKRTLYVILIVY